MIAFAPAKINLGLFITGKRKDGFHSIESLFYPVPLMDALEVHESEEFSLNMYGIEIPGNSEDNLVAKAWKLMKDQHGIGPVRIDLLKGIPAGAGMGGGSSDGATCLKLLNEYFGLKLPQKVLLDYAGRLGSDCPFFIKDGPQWVTGRGEILEQAEVDLKGKYLTIVMPGIHISTAEAFSNISVGPAHVNFRSQFDLPIEHWQSVLENDFEPYVFAKYPELGKARRKLYDLGAGYAQMTGTGSTLFALSDAPLDGLENTFSKWRIFESVL